MLQMLLVSMPLPVDTVPTVPSIVQVAYGGEGLDGSTSRVAWCDSHGLQFVEDSQDEVQGWRSNLHQPCVWQRCDLQLETLSSNCHSEGLGKYNLVLMPHSHEGS